MIGRRRCCSQDPIGRSFTHLFTYLLSLIYFLVILVILILCLVIDHNINFILFLCLLEFLLYYCVNVLLLFLA